MAAMQELGRDDVPRGPELAALRELRTYSPGGLAGGPHGPDSAQGQNASCRRKQPRGRALVLQVNEWLSESRHLSPNDRTWALSSHRPPHAEAKAPGTPGTRPPDETHQPGPRAGAPQGLELFRHLGGEGLKVAPGVLLIADPAGNHGP